MNKKLFVAQLPWKIDDQALKDLFAAAGTVVSATIIMDRETGRSRGFGFVEMSSEEEAQKAIENFNGQNLEGRKLVVNLAKPEARRERTDRHGRSY